MEITRENKSFEIEAFQTNLTIERFLGVVSGEPTNATIVVISGIHGNERAGVVASKNVINTLQKSQIKFNGNFYAISGNLNALKKNIRFHTVDLNRVWTTTQVEDICNSINGFNPDIKEQIALYNCIKDILKKNEGPFYFIDLHTTSADTEPFITISDSLNNRKFTSNFSIPVILGIEEYLEGPLLTYINEYGHISLGFEGGQHEDNKSIENCEAFLWLSLVMAKCINKTQVINYKKYEHLLCKKKKEREFYEIINKYHIEELEDFKMLKDFKNFQVISKNELLAYSNGNEVRATFDGYIFMPLYQKQGKDGFFIIRKISRHWLFLSKIVRMLKFHYLLRILPGIKQDRKNKYTLIVNVKTAKFLATEIFHLFGYRKKIKNGSKWYFIKRDRKVSQFY